MPRLERIVTIRKERQRDNGKKKQQKYEKRVQAEGPKGVSEKKELKEKFLGKLKIKEAFKIDPSKKKQPEKKEHEKKVLGKMESAMNKYQEDQEPSQIDKLNSKHFLIDSIRNAVRVYKFKRHLKDNQNMQGLAIIKMYSEIHRIAHN